MENQLQTLVCPNCGASTTNHHNCDYCGSILVRFAAQNITVDQTKYGKNAVTIPGLKEELKKNLLFQKADNKDQVLTNVFYQDRLVCYIESPNCQVGGMLIHPLPGTTIETPLNSILELPEAQDDSHEGLIVDFLYYHHPGSIGEEGLHSQFGWTYEHIAAFKRALIEETMEEDAFLQSSFASLAEMEKIEGDACGFLLFCDEVDEPNWARGAGYFTHYSIDFRNDYEGAADVVTQYLYEVKKMRDTEHVRFTTNVHSKWMDKMEKKEAENQKKENNINNIIRIIIVILSILLTLPLLFL